MPYWDRWYHFERDEVQGSAEGEPLSLYFDVRPTELVDLEVAASAAIEWARGIKAAARALDDTYDYRVSLVAAEPGSSKWLARVERSKPNQAAEQIKEGWERIPLVFRWTIALAVVIPTTAVPTIDYWTGGGAEFSPKQLQQMEEAYRHIAEEPTVKAHRQAIYNEAQRDPKIIGVGGGVADKPEWKPPHTVPANQFAEGSGLFEPEEEAPSERVVSSTLDVVLVTPQLKNAPRTWTFRQEGIPGTFNATMKDKRFLAALDRSAVRETFRLNIPMRIRLEIKQQFVDGDWKVKRQGRSVVEVISPQID
ncbi:MAG TPA: hypothetical protein VHM92_02755 [Allosphingosinicella sp.]|nr:hypothetical protein [Allosphingosinicella sp.]